MKKKADGFRIVFLKSAIALPAEAPEFFQVFPAGEVHIEGRGKPAIMDDRAAALVLSNFNQIEHDTVIDYEHQTLTGKEAPAAGWIAAKGLEWRGKDGLWAKAEWTERAAGMIERKEYRYHSPVALSRKSDDRIVAIYNVALTNQPRIKNSAAIAAKQDILDLINHHEKGANTMWEKLKKLLGLAADVDEDKTFEAVETLVTKNTELEKSKGDKAEIIACKEVLEVLKLDGTADAAAVVSAIAALSSGTGTGAAEAAAVAMGLEVTALRGEISAMKQGDLTAEALKNGQTSAEELKAWGTDLALKSPEQFRLIVLSRPVGSVVPIEKIGDPPKGTRGEVADDTQLEINKMMGVDAETFKKYAPGAEA